MRCRSRGKNVRGASTITQQVMKNFLLSGDRTVERKIKEIILATRLESTLSKDKILELYLNEIFLGQNSYGVAAAAQTYFNKSLTELDPARGGLSGRDAEGAAASLHPVREQGRVRWNAANYVLREMWQNGYIDEATYADGQGGQPLLTVQNGDYRGLPRSPAAARLFHRRNPPPAVGHLRRGGVLLGRPDHPRHGGPRVAGGRRRRAARGAGEI